jgi:hypothetical protein
VVEAGAGAIVIDVVDVVEPASMRTTGGWPVLWTW